MKHIKKFENYVLNKYVNFLQTVTVTTQKKLIEKTAERIRFARTENQESRFSWSFDGRICCFGFRRIVSRCNERIVFVKFNFTR